MQLEKNNIQRHCASIASLILQKLSIGMHCDALERQTCIIRYGIFGWEENMVKFRRELVKRCCKALTTIEELREYISSVDQCVYIVNNVHLFLINLDKVPQKSYCIRGSKDTEFYWDALHALSLLEYGMCILAF
jgi:hypothetical protein